MACSEAFRVLFLLGQAANIFLVYWCFHFSSFSLLGVLPEVVSTDSRTKFVSMTQADHLSLSSDLSAGSISTISFLVSFSSP